MRTTRWGPKFWPGIRIALPSCAVACLISDPSWFMRCLSEPIARRASWEDLCKGAVNVHGWTVCRFCRSKKPAWEGRCKCQVLLDEVSVVAAMAYADLNPVRAKMCDSLEASHHTSAKLMVTEIAVNTSAGNRPVGPITGFARCQCHAVGRTMPTIVATTARARVPTSFVHNRRRCECAGRAS